MYSSNLAGPWPPSASPNSLDHGLQVHIQTRSITASKCLSEFTRSPSPSASQTCSIKYIVKERWRLYGDTGVTEVDRVMGSVYLAGPGVVLATVPVLDPAGFIGLRGNGLTPSKIVDFLSAALHYGYKY